jgi:predicted DNA binding CopG/RHH family protein
MNTINYNIQNPYKTNKSFLIDPFTPLYQTSDEEIPQNESVENLIHYAWSLEECIPGDFDLKTVITEIKSQILSFVRTGLLAYKVKFHKLYRRVHKNFKTFCEKALGISHWQINRKIEAARVVMELAQAGFSILPTCEAQARPLTKLYGAELCNKWKMVVDSLEPHTITSNQINEVLGVETKTTSLRLPKKLYEQIKRKALEMGLSIEQFLNMILDDDQKISPVEEEILVKWEEDLETFADYEIKNIQTQEESMPIGTLSEKDESYTSSSQLQQDSVKTFHKTKKLKHSNLEYKDLISVSEQKDYVSPVKKTKNFKNKKPLLEVLSLDKKHNLKNKEIKEKTNSDDENLNKNFSKIDDFKQNDS